MRHLKHLTFAVILFAAAGYAQTPAPATPPTPPAPAEKVTDLELAGLQHIGQEYQEVLKQLSQANIDVAKNHPGFHLDPKNPLSGTLEKDPPAKSEKPDTGVKSPTPITPKK